MVDALDECLPEHQLEVLDALEQILERSPKVRVFITGRPHVRLVVRRGLDGRATSVPIKPRDGNIVQYLRTRLKKDATPKAMNGFLENDIMNSTPGDISETFLPFRGLLFQLRIICPAFQVQSLFSFILHLRSLLPFFSPANHGYFHLNRTVRSVCHPNCNHTHLFPNPRLAGHFYKPK